MREQTGRHVVARARLCSEGRVTVDGERCLDPATRISPEAVVVVDAHGPKLRRAVRSPKSAIVFFDRDVVVVDKPAGVLSVADEPGNRDTLATTRGLCCGEWAAVAPTSALGVVHRLDKDTSG